MIAAAITLALCALILTFGYLRASDGAGDDADALSRSAAAAQAKQSQ